jgi:tRNA(fMet)-specific endonuclease VapC
MKSERRFMLDTDTISFVLRGEGGVGAALTAQAPSAVCMSAMSLCELRFGADKRRSKRLHQLIDVVVATVAVVAFDAAAATTFGRLASALQTRGTPIGQLDTLIAAHAMSLKLTLVTNNSKHFGKVRGLKTTNWFQSAG